VGELKKSIQVMGPRYWQYRTLTGWQLSEPKPCLEVPIRYELAFGGSYLQGNQWCSYEYNPLGIGLFYPKYAYQEDYYPGPQIEDPQHPVKQAGKFYTPQGFGPIGRSWLPRLKLAGTYDENWQKNRWPELPEDFDFAYYNSAHPDLIYPTYLTGNEEIKFSQWQDKLNSSLTCRLPGYSMMVLLRYQNGAMALAPLLLDTLYLDLSSTHVEEYRAHLIWRSVFRVDRPIRVVEARMERPKVLEGNYRA
jgi:hypothetical protein